MVKVPGLSPMELYNMIQRATFSAATQNSHAGVPSMCIMDVRQREAYDDGHIKNAKFVGPDPVTDEQTMPFDYEGCDVVLYGDRESIIRLNEVSAKIAKARDAASVRTLVAFFEEFSDSYPFMIVETADEEESEFEETNKAYKLTFPSEIVARRLYLSDGNQAKNAAVVKAMGFTHIVNATSNLENKFESDGIKYFRVPVQDSSVSDISEYFERSYKFIKKAHESSNRNKVLVHCSQGISRSATIVIYYLMREKKMSLKEAKEFVTTCRPWIWPNEGFMRQLGRVETDLKSGKFDKKGKNGCILQ